MSVKLNNVECCGCGACENICPKHAITMAEDKETFRYPSINKDLCVECGLCEKTCPLNYDDYIKPDGVKALVGINKSADVNFKSSSGGAFSSIYESYLQDGYIIYGVKFDENLQPVHDAAGTAEECEKFRKSKYVQSLDNGCYKKAAADLKAGKKVLFSGTSCQCAALNAFMKALRINTENLVTVAIVCHGVPSQRMFEEYVKEEERKQNAKIISYSFKNKAPHDNGIDTRSSYIIFDNGQTSIRTTRNDPFLRGYYLRLFYRPSCGLCHFALQERVSDITIADAWGINKQYPELKPVEGVSLILFNTAKGKEKLAEISEKMNLYEVSTDWALNSQALFSRPTEMNPNRQRFFELWEKTDFKKAVYRCTRPTFKKTVLFALRPIKKALKKIKK